MLPKALWVKEWKHTSMLNIGLFIAFFIGFPVQASLQLDSWSSMERNDPMRWANSKEHLIQDVFNAGFFSVIAVILILVLAGLLVGLEKNTKRHDFMMALPFSRMQLFLTKFSLGALVIVISYTLNFWAAYLVIQQSEYTDLMVHVSLDEAFFFSLIGYFMVYTLSMLIGAITGEIKSQLFLTTIFMFFIQGFYLLLMRFLNINFGYEPDFGSQLIFEDLFFGSYFSYTYMDANWWLGLLWIALFFILSIFAYQKAQAEYSGEFLILPKLRPFMSILLIVSGALLGGYLTGMIVPYGGPEFIEWIVYWFGLVIALFFSWKITKRLMNYDRK